MFHLCAVKKYVKLKTYAKYVTLPLQDHFRNFMEPTNY